MLTIKNFEKIKGKEFTSHGVEWKIVRVVEMRDIYEFTIRSETHPQIRIGIDRNKVFDVELRKPVYKVYKNYEFFDNYVTPDWIANINNVLDLFGGLC